MNTLYDPPQRPPDDPDDDRVTRDDHSVKLLVATLTHDGLIPAAQIPRGRADRLLYRWAGLVPPTREEIEAALDWFPGGPCIMHGDKILFFRQPVAHSIVVTPDQWVELLPGDDDTSGLVALTVSDAGVSVTVLLNPAHVHQLRLILAVLDPTVRVPYPWEERT